MKYIILIAALLFSSTAQADELDYFLGSYSVTAQSGSSIHAPRCVESATPKKINISITRNKLGQINIVEPKFKLARLVNLYIDFREGGSSSPWLHVIYSLPTNENYNLYRILIITPYRDNSGDAEIDGLVWGEDDEGKLQCWSSIVAVGKFKKQVQ